jgi:hypothetical protein
MMVTMMMMAQFTKLRAIQSTSGVAWRGMQGIVLSYASRNAAIFGECCSEHFRSTIVTKT